MILPSSEQSAGGRRVSRIRALPSGARVVLFLLCLAMVWGPLALLIHRGLGGGMGQPHAATAIALLLLYALFVVLVRVWGRRVHHWAKPLRHLGWVGGGVSFLRRLAMATALGLGGVVLLFGLELGLGWATFQWPSWSWARLLTEAALVGLAYGLLEELLFRGWLLAELEAGSRGRTALIANATVFALAHFIKPLPEIIRTFPQFVGLLILGLALVWARRTTSRQITPDWQPTSLALPMGLHAGLVGGYYLFNVGNLVAYTGQVPEWITGIDRNPLAGGLGVVLLIAIATLFARQAQTKTSQSLACEEAFGG
ncbi:MAG: CPBP family intramembrane glutamic endopeptidase [Cyanobacteria bacterium J06632_22]